ncbi:threonine/serine exporter family protein [Guggenheimella bovis]
MIILSISAFIGTFAVAILYNIRKRHLFVTALVGGVTFFIYLFLKKLTNSEYVSIFFTSSIIGISGEVLARVYRCPSTVFVIPAIICLVPGAGMYYTMLSLTNKAFQETASFGTQTVFSAISIACGLSLALALRRIIKKWRIDTPKN